MFKGSKNKHSPLAIRDKTITNKWTYERSHKSLNSYSLVEYNKIYPNTNSWKICKKRVHVMEDFDNLYFWNTLNKIHQDILVWNRNKRLHIINKKHMHKKKKETTHEEIGERRHISSYIYIYIYLKNKHNVCKHGHKTSV